MVAFGAAMQRMPITAGERGLRRARRSLSRRISAVFPAPEISAVLAIRKCILKQRRIDEANLAYPKRKVDAGATRAPPPQFLLFLRSGGPFWRFRDDAWRDRNRDPGWYRGIPLDPSISEPRRHPGREMRSLRYRRTSRDRLSRAR